MEKILGEYGDAFITGLFGGAIITIFVQVFNYVTSF